MRKIVFLLLLLLFIPLAGTAIAQDEAATSGISLRANNLEMVINQAFIIDELPGRDIGTLLVLDIDLKNHRGVFTHCYEPDEFLISQGEMLETSDLNDDVRTLLYPDREAPGLSEDHCVSAGTTEPSVISFEIDTTSDTFWLSFEPTEVANALFQYTGDFDNLTLTVLQSSQGDVSTIIQDEQSTSSDAQSFDDLTSFEQWAYTFPSSGIYAIRGSNLEKDNNDVINVTAIVDVLPGANQVETAAFLASAARTAVIFDDLTPVESYTFDFTLWDRQSSPIQYMQNSSESGEWDTDILNDLELEPIERLDFLDPPEPAQFAVTRNATPVRVGASTDPSDPFLSEIIFTAPVGTDLRVEQENTYDSGEVWYVVWFYDEQLDFYRSGFVESSDVTIETMPASYDEQQLDYIPTNERSIFVNAASVNLRAGPSTNDQIVGTASQGDELIQLGTNPDETWYYVQLQDGSNAWIFATLTSPDSPTGSVPATQSATIAAPCDCYSGNTLNCADFSNRVAAQRCYDGCVRLVGSDVHGLDGDGNGRACE